MAPPPPPEEIAQLMQFIANKTKNVTSPMSVKELCRQFKAESGTLLVIGSVEARIRLYRHRIHEMNEFDTGTKVKMMFALGATVDSGFLIELKKVAEVDVDDQQRIIHFKQRDGTLELSAKPMKLSTSQSEQRNEEIIQFLVKKSETINTPIPDKSLLREFKETTGCPDSIYSLHNRYYRVKNTIFENTRVNKSTKIKMMFISHTKLSEDILEKLRQDAVVEVDEERRITKYKANDGGLDMEGNHELSSIMKSFHSNRWKNICQKAETVESKDDEKVVSNWQKGYEKKQIDFVRFLIERTKNATAPLSIAKLAKDYETEFKSPADKYRTHKRIRSFRQRIHKMNEFNMSTKIKMMFALSASVDADFLKEIQQDAIVELDEKQRIKKYKANDGSLALEVNHSFSSNILARKVLSGSNRERYSQSTSLSQLFASIQNKSKRVKAACSSSEVFKEKDDEKSMTREMMEYGTNNADDGRYDYFYYDPPNYEDDMEHIQMEMKPESLMKVKIEVPDESSTSIGRDHFFFDYDPPTYDEDMEQNLEEKKPESLIEVKTEDFSTSNL